MALSHTIRFITQHPLNADRPLQALWRFAKWQWKSRTQKGPHIVPFVENTRLWANRGWTGVTGNIYAGLHEYEDMAFLLHFLRPGDVFADVGANHGSYTILASGVCGAFTHAFEPVPETFGHLADNITLNQLENLTTLYNAAVGSKNGELWFSSNEDTTNHAETEPNADSIKVPCVRLDDVLANARPGLMKIDVEGFETEVLNGATNLLGQPELKAIIIELNGSGGRYGYDEKAIHQKLLALGYQTYQYDPRKRHLESSSSYGAHNTLYLKDVESVKYKLFSAPKRIINHHSI